MLNIKQVKYLYLQFTVYSDLGRVVQAIIREFSKNPPQLLEENSPLTGIFNHILKRKFYNHFYKSIGSCLL